MRVALFTTCLVDSLFPGVGVATVTLLRRLGIGVATPAGQTCCGQIHVNSGYAAMALPLLRNHVDAFEDAEVVVAPSGSCVGLVRSHYAGLARRTGDQRLIDRVEALAARTFELSEFLVDVVNVVDVGARYPYRVTYHPSCHSLRLLRVGDRPRRLLEKVRDLELVELPEAESCCGFGGTFAVKNADTSAVILADKLAAVGSVDVDVVTAGDSSCLMHVRGGLTRTGSPTRAVHLAEILAST